MRKGINQYANKWWRKVTRHHLLTVGDGIIFIDYWRTGVKLGSPRLMKKNLKNHPDFRVIMGREYDDNVL